MISALFGHLFKIDEFTSTLSRSKYARVCVEVDLAKPWKQGFCLGDDDHRVFVIVLYEWLPMFYYYCGLVGHGTKTCNCRSSRSQGNPSPPRCLTQVVNKGRRLGMSSFMSKDMDARMVPRTPNINGKENSWKRWQTLSLALGCLFLGEEVTTKGSVVLGTSGN